MRDPATKPQSAAMRRTSGRQWVLKPQDLAVALKLVSLQGAKFAYAALGQSMHLSPFEAHAAIQRLQAAKLVVKRANTVRPIVPALRSFVLHGAPYAYPPVRGEITIGFETAHSAPPLRGRVQASAEAVWVWPHAQGPTRGEALLPLYENLPLAAVADPKLYEMLALFDALRAGQARERKLAAKMLEERLA